MWWLLLACAGSRVPDPDPTPGPSVEETGAVTSPSETGSEPTSPTGTDPSETGPGDTGTTAAPADPTGDGPYAVRTTVVSVALSCTTDVSLDLPDGVAPVGLVVLAHGFARDRSHQAELGARLASWGLGVARPDLCHGGPIGVDHPLNGADLVALASLYRGTDPVWYVGHSAGGLAAWLAAAEDPTAAGHLGLDTVDTSNLGASAAVTVPAAALLGEPEACNSRGNAVAMYDGAATLLRLPGADHCDFEGPTDALCTAFCANGASTTAEADARAMATAWLLWQSGIAPEAEGWWEGPGFDALVAQGRLEVVE